MMKRSLLPVVAVLAAAGCSTTPPLQDSAALAVSKVDELPPPGPGDVVAATETYLIGPQDKLIVDVFGIEQLAKREFQVDAGGNVAIPLAGTVRAAGLSPQDLAAAITRRLRAAYVRDPQVAVNVMETTSRSFTVEGSVTEPGIYPITGRMSLIRAVASAKGLSEFAKSEYVVVFRDVGGKRYAALYNLDAIRGGYYPDPQIYANDIVVVNESRARRMFKDALSIAPALLTPVVLLLQ